MFESLDFRTGLIIAIMLGIKLPALRKFWVQPLKQGAGWFLTTEVVPDFYQKEGAGFLRRYRCWLLAPILADIAAVGIMIFFGQIGLILFEQAATYLLIIIFFNFVLIQFAYKAKKFAVKSEEKTVTAARVVMQPRRLLDYTNRTMEIPIIFLNLLPVVQAIFFYTHSPGLSSVPSDWEPDFFLWSWMVYLQIGLLLLKQVFVKWRYKLPVARAEDFQRWRAAWLRYHLRIFDAARLLLAFALVDIFFSDWINDLINISETVPASMILLAAAIIFFIGWASREYRQLMKVEKEIEPAKLVKEFPPAPVADEKFFAGGLIYINSNNPVMFARSPQGIALNLANRGVYLWAGYLTGLILLMAWRFK